MDCHQTPWNCLPKDKYRIFPFRNNRLTVRQSVSPSNASWAKPTFECDPHYNYNLITCNTTGIEPRAFQNTGHGFESHWELGIFFFRVGPWHYRSFVRSFVRVRSVGMKSKVDQCLELLGSWFVQEVNWSTYACSYQHRDLLLKLSRFTGISASYKRVP